MRKLFSSMLSGLLVCSMILSSTPVFAADSDTESETKSKYPEVVIEEVEDIEIDLFDASMYPVPALKEGRYENWIDRIDFTGYEDVREVYDWLAEATDNDGIDDFLIEDLSDDMNVTIATMQYSSYEELMNNYQADYPYYIGYFINTLLAFKMDYPEVFWINRSLKPGITAGTNGQGAYARIYLKVKNSSDNYSLRGSEYDSEEVLRVAIAKREKYINDILATAADCTNNYEKLFAFNHYLVMNNEYCTGDITNDFAHECLSALEGNYGDKGPVCEGYAKSFKILCDRSNIPCVLVTGIATNSSGGAGGHMWNNVKLNGNWYGVDTTWNDPLGGKPGAVSGNESGRFMLVGGETIVSNMTFNYSHSARNHLYDDNVEDAWAINGPVLSDVAYVKPKDHFDNDGDGLCDDDGCTYRFSGVGAEIGGSNISLSDEIAVNIYFDFEKDITSNEAAYVQFTHEDGKTDKVYVSDIETSVQNGHIYYKVPCAVSSIEMSDTIEVQVIVDDEHKSEVYEYSISDYANDVLSGSGYSEKEVNMVKAMLNYGAYSQKYFNYNTENLANDILSEADKELAPIGDLSDYAYTESYMKDGELTPGENPDSLITYVGSSLLLKSKITIRYYFDIDKSVDINDINVEAEREGIKLDVAKLCFSKEVSSDVNRYYVDIDKIAVGHYKDTYKLTVGDIVISNYSPMSYANTVYTSPRKNEPLKALLAAMKTYDDVASNY